MPKIKDNFAKKPKKTLNTKPLKKSKIKSVVNVKINIDNSKKPTIRRVTTKAPTQQPFVNFPSYQPTRIQQLEPKQQFNSADLTKSMDEYQKQFKTYLETKDQDVKKMIEEFDDTLKKSKTPPKNKKSKPGAFDVYADNEGEVVYEQPVKSTPPSVKQDTWNNPNEFKHNTMLETDVEPLSANQLFEETTPLNIQEVKPLNIEEVVRGLGSPELKQGISEAKNMLLEGNVLKKYKDYVSAYKQYYDNDDYEKKKSAISASGWALKENAILKKIKEFGTYQEQLIKESKDKEIERINKQLKKQSKKQVKKQRQNINDFFVLTEE